MFKPQTYTVPADLMQAVVHVLGALPWAQVHPLMSALVPVIQAQETPAVPELPAAPAQPNMLAPA